MILGVDHVGIACTDIQRAIRRYEELFDLELAKYEERPASGVLEAMLASRTDPSTMPGGRQSYVQLLQPTRGDTALARFLRLNGEGLQHVGYAVTSVASVLAHLRTKDVRVIPDMPDHGI